MTEENTARKSFRFFHRTLFALAALIVLTIQNVSPASAQSTVNLQNAVYRMNAWMSGSENAVGWRKFLHLNLLDAQAALGDQADLFTLQKIYRRFDSDTDGLDALEFQDVRSAIKSQIEALSKVISRDLVGMSQQAKSAYQPISIAQMEQARDEAVYELKLLKSYYRNTMSSRKRADLFYDLQLNDQIDFLDSIEFELPPEISVGKTTSQIKDERERLDEVQQEIDALPADSDEEDDERPGPDDDPLLLPPRPDDGDLTLDELKEKRQRIQQRIDELKEMRLELAEKDRDRVDTRKQVLRQLAKFDSRFEDVAKKRFDPYFLSVALTAERFNFLYFYGTDDNLQEDYLERVKTLQENLIVLVNPETTDRISHAEVGKLIQWFESANQIPEIVSAVRARFSNPNLYLSVSSNMINQIAGQDVSERQRIKQTIFGRIIRGVVNTNGSVQVNLNPDPNQANVTIQLLGTITSQTYTRERSFRIDLSASGSYSGRRNIYANVGGFYADLADVNACVFSCYGGINSNIGLVQKLAAKQFAKTKSRGDAEGSRRAKEQVLELFTEQTDDALAQGQKQFSKLQEKMIDKQSLIPAAYLRTHSDRVELVAIKQNQGSLAASESAMNYGVNRDLQVKIHETFLSNFTDTIFAGKTFTNEELKAEAMKRFDIKPSEVNEAETAEEEAIQEENFSITFSRVRPIQFEFEDNRLAVTVTGVRFAQEGRAIRAGLRFRVVFKIEDVNGQLQVRRDGPAEIEYLEPEKKDAKLVAFRSLLEKKLNLGLKDDEGIPIPRNLIPVDQLDNVEIAGKLLLSQLRFEQGWAYVGWEYAPYGYPATPVDTPAIEYAPYVPDESGMGVTEEMPSSTEMESSPPMPVGSVLEGEIYAAPTPVQ